MWNGGTAPGAISDDKGSAPTPQSGGFPKPRNDCSQRRNASDSAMTASFFLSESIAAEIEISEVVML